MGKKQPVAKKDKWHKNVPDLSKLKQEDFDVKYQFKRNIAMCKAYFSGKMLAVDLGIKYGLGVYRVRQICYDLQHRVNKTGIYAPGAKEKSTKKVNKKSSTKKVKTKAKTKK